MIDIQTAAVVATVMFLVLGAFQLGLAVGMPWGRAAWGGKVSGRLPPRLRIGSAVSIVVYAISAVLVLDGAGMPIIDVPAAVSQWGAWLVLVLLAVGALMNAASSSPYERFGWAPFAAALALLCTIVALG